MYLALSADSCGLEQGFCLSQISIHQMRNKTQPISLFWHCSWNSIRMRAALCRNWVMPGEWVLSFSSGSLWCDKCCVAVNLEIVYLKQKNPSENERLMSLQTKFSIVTVVIMWLHIYSLCVLLHLSIFVTMYSKSCPLKGLLLKVAVFLCGSPSSLHPPLKFHRALPSAWGHSQWLHHLLERWRLLLEFTQANAPSASWLWKAQWDLQWPRVATSVVFLCIQVLAGPCMLQPCSGMTHRTIFFPPATPRTFPPTLCSPGSACCMCERLKSELTRFYRTLLYFCRVSCGLHPAAGLFFFFWLFFAMLMEAASWNYHELPLSNDLLVKPTITAVSRPSEHS